MECVEKVYHSEIFQNAMAFLKQDREKTLAQQLELAQIPALSNHEENKAARIAEMIQEAGYDDVITDEVSNVYTIIKGSGNGPKVLIVAHSDTVFPMDTDLTVRKTPEGRIYCPGICDDTRGVAEILSMLRAIKACEIRPVGDIVIGSDVGEENEGKMRGVQHLCKTIPDLDGFISIDLNGMGTLVYSGTGSNRYRISFNGVGGHSFTAFGIPNPAYAAGRAVAAIADLNVPKSPRTTFNVGVLSGGTAATAIPRHVEIQVDIRSNGEQELAELDRQLREIVAKAVEDENLRWGNTNQVTYEIEPIGTLPVAQQSADATIAKVGIHSLACLGVEYTPRPEGAGPTDSNMAIKRGIPAITMGRGGKGGGGHSVQEWFEPVDEYKGPQKNLLALLALVGVEGVSKPGLEKRT